MIKKGNFSGNAAECFKKGKTQFFKEHQGIYNGDLNELWAEIEQKSKEAFSTKKPSKK